MICGIFTFAGLGMLASGEVLFGLLAIVFFGGGGAFYFIRNARGGITFKLTPQGILPGSGGFVPWQEVGRIGATTTGGAKAVGVEVLDIPAYVATLTPEQQRTVLRTANIGRVAGPVLGSGELSSIPTGDLAAAINWAAANSGGYQLAFPAMTLNKTIPAVVQLLEGYRAAALGRPPLGWSGQQPQR